MEISVNPQRRRYLARKVRSGAFKSPSDVIDFALRRLQGDDKDLGLLNREIKKGLDSVDRGEVSDWDVEQEKSRLLQRVARQRRRN